jgi:hypothetical protein
LKNVLVQSLKNSRPALSVILSIGCLAGRGLSQQKEDRVPSCSQKTFVAVKEIPKIEYDCPADSNDYDNKILKLPARAAAIARLTGTLQSFTEARWWQAEVDELNACELHGQPGNLTDEEKEKWRSGDYHFSLLGDREMRLLLLADPCYQTGFGGSNAFLLLRKNGKVLVTQVLNGYFSRVDNSVGFDTANLRGRQILEVSTANSFPPSVMNYYFEIDPATHKALPRKLFKEGNKLTNQIYSDLLMAEPKDLGLPKDAVELHIICNHRLAPSFSAYVQDEHGPIDGRLRRIIYRWNGRFYRSERR